IIIERGTTVLGLELLEALLDAHFGAACGIIVHGGHLGSDEDVLSLEALLCHRCPQCDAQLVLVLVDSGGVEEAIASCQCSTHRVRQLLLVDDPRDAQSDLGDVVAVVEREGAARDGVEADRHRE
ncbi:hypothetical protein PMAYCL1PPCAC_03440, partial [Pristionchus mayeri]